MINKEDYRNMDSIMNWGKYAEALEQEVARLEKEVQHRDVALKCYEKLFEHATNEINKLKEAFDNACCMLNEVATCPLDKLDCDIGCEHKCNSELSMDYTECWKEYFLKEIENE